MELGRLVLCLFNSIDNEWSILASIDIVHVAGVLTMYWSGPMLTAYPWSPYLNEAKPSDHHEITASLLADPPAPTRPGVCA